MVVLSLDGLVKCLNKQFKQNDIKIMKQNYKGDGYEYIIELFKDIDYPKHYRITIEEI